MRHFGGLKSGILSSETSYIKTSNRIQQTHMSKTSINLMPGNNNLRNQLCRTFWLFQKLGAANKQQQKWSFTKKKNENDNISGCSRMRVTGENNHYDFNCL